MTKELVDKIFIILTTEESLLTIWGGFVGAFFASLFFIFNEQWRSKRAFKIKWVIKYKREHAYLERYLPYLLSCMDINIQLQEVIMGQYKDKQIALRNLQLLPVRDDSSMRLNDIDFLNKVEKLMCNLRTINADINAFNGVQNKMNDNIEKYIFDEQRADMQEKLEKSLDIFLEDSKVIVNFQKMEKDKVLDLLAENKYLYDYYSNGMIKKIVAKLKRKLDANYRENEIGKRRENLLKQVEDNTKKNREELKKYGVIK